MVGGAKHAHEERGGKIFRRFTKRDNNLGVFLTRGALLCLVVCVSSQNIPKIYWVVSVWWVVVALSCKFLLFTMNSHAHNFPSSSRKLSLRKMRVIFLEYGAFLSQTASCLPNLG